MEISVNESEYCKLDVHCEANAELVGKKFDEVARMYKTAHVPGFRPGKATVEAVKVYYKKQIGEAVKSSLAQEAFDNLVAEKSVRPIGQPDFSKIELSSEKFVCDFSLKKTPDFQLGNSQKSTVDEVTEQVLVELSLQHGEAAPFSETDVVAMGDNVILSYESSIDGQKQENLSSSAESIVVGKSNVEGFDDSLVGMKMGESKTFDIVIPQTSLPSLAGKTVSINASLLYASKTVPHAIDDTLATKLGKENLEALREEARTMATSRVEELDRNELLKLVQEKLDAEHTFEVPEWLTLSEAKFLVSKSNSSWDFLPEEDQQRYMQDARKGLKVSMILDKVRENEPDAQLSEEEVVNAVRALVEKSGRNFEEEVQNLSKNGQIGMLVARVKEEYTLDFILKNSNIVD
jgi:trigger factor